MRSFFLGHDLFASDVAWISALIYFGDWRLSGTRTPPRHLIDYANLVQALDPDFKPIYDWINTTYINARKNPQMQDLHTVTDFLERGMERFPSDCEFPYMAGSNYVGYSKQRSPRERLEEIARAIGYYERASLLDGCRPMLPFTLGYFYKRRRALVAQIDGDVSVDDALSRTQQRDFLKDVFLLTSDDEVRTRARASLSSLGLSEADIDALSARYTWPLQRARARTYSFLPQDHWTLIVAPTESVELEEASP